MPLVALDLDRTLIDQVRAARLWAEEFGAQWHLPGDAIASVASALGQRGPKDLVFERIVEEWSLPLSGASLWAAYRARMPHLVRCSPEDKEALTDLRAAGWTLGIVTNGMADNQEGKIRASGLAALVDGWVVSSEAGVRKPDSRIFELLAQRVDCELDGWMIGDSLEHDVLGGATAGCARRGSPL